MEQKQKLWWGLGLLAAGIASYAYGMSVITSNSYRTAEYFNRASQTPKTFAGIGLLVGIVGLIFLLRFVFHWLMWRNSDENEDV